MQVIRIQTTKLTDHSFNKDERGCQAYLFTGANCLQQTHSLRRMFHAKLAPHSLALTPDRVDAKDSGTCFGKVADIKASDLSGFKDLLRMLQVAVRSRR